MTKYMHTMDREPASFDGFQVCFTGRKIKLADSLKQIRREQRLSNRNRFKDGLKIHDRIFGYATVIV